MYAQSRKDVFNTLPVCTFKLSKLGSIYSGNATETSAVRLIIISFLRLINSLIYIIRCTLREVAYHLSVYVDIG